MSPATLFAISVAGSVDTLDQSGDYVFFLGFEQKSEMASQSRRVDLGSLLLRHVSIPMFLNLKTAAILVPLRYKTTKWRKARTQVSHAAMLKLSLLSSFVYVNLHVFYFIRTPVLTVRHPPSEDRLIRCSGDCVLFGDVCVCVFGADSSMVVAPFDGRAKRGRCLTEKAAAAAIKSHRKLEFLCNRALPSVMLRNRKKSPPLFWVRLNLTGYVGL